MTGTNSKAANKSKQKASVGEDDVILKNLKSVKILDDRNYVFSLETVPEVVANEDQQKHRDLLGKFDSHLARIRSSVVSARMCVNDIHAIMAYRENIQALVDSADHSKPIALSGMNSPGMEDRRATPAQKKHEKLQMSHKEINKVFPQMPAFANSKTNKNFSHLDTNYSATDPVTNQEKNSEEEVGHAAENNNFDHENAEITDEEHKEVDHEAVHHHEDAHHKAVHHTDGQHEAAYDEDAHHDSLDHEAVSHETAHREDAHLKDSHHETGHHEEVYHEHVHQEDTNHEVIHNEATDQEVHHEAAHHEDIHHEDVQHRNVRNEDVHYVEEHNEDVHHKDVHREDVHHEVVHEDIHHDANEEDVERGVLSDLNAQESSGKDDSVELHEITTTRDGEAEEVASDSTKSILVTLGKVPASTKRVSFHESTVATGVPAASSSIAEPIEGAAAEDTYDHTSKYLLEDLQVLSKDEVAADVHAPVSTDEGKAEKDEQVPKSQFSHALQENVKTSAPSDSREMKDSDKKVFESDSFLLKAGSSAAGEKDILDEEVLPPLGADREGRFRSSDAAAFIKTQLQLLMQPRKLSYMLKSIDTIIYKDGTPMMLKKIEYSDKEILVPVPPNSITSDSEAGPRKMTVGPKEKFDQSQGETCDSAVKQKLGPVAYKALMKTDSGSGVKVKVRGINWTRQLQMERMAGQPHILYKDQWELNKMLKSQLGPGSYEIKDFIHLANEKPRSGRGIINNLGARFDKAVQSFTPGPGAYGIGGVPQKALEENARNSCSTKGLLDAGNRKRNLPSVGSHLGPGTYAHNYKSGTDQLLSKVVSTKGPYNLFSGERSDGIAAGYFATPKHTRTGPGQYKIKDFVDDLLGRDCNYRGRFGKAAQYPKVPSERVFYFSQSQHPHMKSPGPADYCIREQTKFKTNKTTGFSSSSKRDDKLAQKLFCNISGQVGPGRYDFEKFEGQDVNGHTNVFRSKTERPSAKMSKFLQERLQSRNRYKDQPFCQCQPDRKLHSIISM